MRTIDRKKHPRGTLLFLHRLSTFYLRSCHYFAKILNLLRDFDFLNLDDMRYGPHIDLVMGESISFMKPEGTELARMPVSDIIELVLQSDRIVELRMRDNLAHIVCFFHQQDCSKFLTLVPSGVRRTRATKRHVVN